MTVKSAPVLLDFTPALPFFHSYNLSSLIAFFHPFSLHPSYSIVYVLRLSSLQKARQDGAFQECITTLGVERSATGGK